MINKTKACKIDLVAWQKRTSKQANVEFNKNKQILRELLNRNRSDIDWEEVKTVQKRIEI